MVGWYDEVGAGATDTFVKINKKTGVATEFPNTGINTSSNGVAFQPFGVVNVLWNIDAPQGTTQTAYVIESVDREAVRRQATRSTDAGSPGGLPPTNNLYYGLNFEARVSRSTFIVVVNPLFGTVTKLGCAVNVPCDKTGQTVDDLHVIAFVKPSCDDDGGH